MALFGKTFKLFTLPGFPTTSPTDAQRKSAIATRSYLRDISLYCPVVDVNPISVIGSSIHYATNLGVLLPAAGVTLDSITNLWQIQGLFSYKGAPDSSERYNNIVGLYPGISEGSTSSAFLIWDEESTWALMTYPDNVTCTMVNVNTGAVRGVNGCSTFGFRSFTASGWDRVYPFIHFFYQNKLCAYSISNSNSANADFTITVPGNTPAITDSVPASFWNGYSADYRPPSASTDPYDNLPTAGDDPIPGGGAVGIPGFPGLTATSAGVIGLFAPTAAQMQQLADFMWTDFGGTGTTVEEILQEVVEALKRTISNPLDYIIGLNIIPSQGLSIGGAKVVRFGFISSGVSMPLLANQYFTVDCGSLSFDTVCGDTFLDYAPYSKFSIYLPYIGFKDVDPNDFVGHTIGVVYHGDCVTGGVTAYITKDGTVMYQYSGCCALNVPLSADNWGETISAAINVATGIVAAAATGGAAGLAQGALKGAASVAANPSLLSPQVSHSGAVSGGAGCMGVQFPFVIREAVNFHSTAGFNKSTGYPAYYFKKLGDVTGFTTVIDAHLSNVPMATQDEIAEIESLLESGVIL